MSDATAPDAGAGQEQGSPVSEAKAEAAAKEEAEDVKALALLRRWVPSLVMGGGLVVSLVTAGVVVSSRLDALEKSVVVIRSEGSPPVQALQSRLGVIDAAVITDRSERIKDHELLLKIDRKLSLLICKGDNTKCSE